MPPPYSLWSTDDPVPALLARIANAVEALLALAEAQAEEYYDDESVPDECPDDPSSTSQA